MSIMNTVKESINKALAEQKRGISVYALKDLKYLWAELERATISKGSPLDEAAEAKIIEKMVNENADTIENYKKIGRDSDPRVEELIAQNSVISGFLPSYATKEEIMEVITSKGMAEHVGSKNGKSIGAITKILKENNVSFKNEVVKEIVFPVV